MVNCFHFIDDKELEKSAYAYLFTLCDRAEYLFDAPYGEADFTIEAIGTPFESMIPALEQQKTGQSWGMWGKILTFCLTDDVKEIIEHAGLDGILRVWNRNLENLALFKDGKRLYDTCSHEGYTDIDDDFLNSVSKFCEQALPQTTLWQQIETRYAKISRRSTQRLWEELDKLDDLDRQIDEAWQRVISCCTLRAIRASFARARHSSENRPLVRACFGMTFSANCTSGASTCSCTAAPARPRTRNKAQRSPLLLTGNASSPI